MNKVSRLRLKIQEQYDGDDLESAAETGETLLREHCLNPNEKSMSYADDLFNLACIYDALGIFDRAVFLYYESAREVISMDGESSAFARRLNNIAALFNNFGHTGRAYNLLLQASAIMREGLEPNDTNLADCIYNLANAAADYGRIAEAMKLHKEALQIRKTAGDDEDVINSLMSMAFIHENARDNKRAMRCASDALAKATGDDYYSTGFYLAGLCDECENFSRSEELYRDILKWVEEHGGKEHSAFINVSLRLGHALARLDRPREALEIFLGIHETFREKNGENHLFFANCLRSMSLLYHQLNEPDKAESFMLQSIRIRRAGDADLIDDKLFLLDMYLDSGAGEKALDLLVYILMKHGNGNKDFLNALSEKKNMAGLLPLIEELNNKETPEPIVRRWEEWEKGEEL